MDKLLEELRKGCSTCKHEESCFDDGYFDSCVTNKKEGSNYEPNDTIKEIDRLIKLGRRYDTDTEINRVKERRWAKEVK